MVEAGASLHVTIPDEFAPDCSDGKLELIALPDSGGCDDSDPMHLVIAINSTIVPAEYTFAFQVTPPLVTPVQNQISIVLKDRYGNVRDAAVDMPGVEIQEKLRIAAKPLWWTQSRPGWPSRITCAFEALEPLPDYIVAPNQQISEILISLPSGFTHLVDTITDFTILNDDMPLADGNTWLDYMAKDRLRVILNLNQSSWTTLKSGIYSFQFQVRVPDPMPIFNVWHISLCRPNFPGGCSRISDPAVLINFAIPGFRIGQEPPGGSSSSSLAASRAVVSSVLFLLIIGLFLLR